MISRRVYQLRAQCLEQPGVREQCNSLLSRMVHSDDTSLLKILSFGTAIISFAVVGLGSLYLYCVQCHTIILVS